MVYAVQVTQFYHAADGVDWAPAFQRAISYVVQNNVGGRVEVPRGVYKTFSPITLQPYVQLVGEGPISAIQSMHTGNCVQTISPINSSTEVYTHVSDLTVFADTSVLGQGAGIVDVAGTYVTIERVSVANFKYGIVFDQTEISSITACVLGACERGIWLVNGGEFTPGAWAGVTNNITISGRCQFNACVYGIVDDGGGLHTITDGNFNACTTAAMYVAGLESGLIYGMEVEGCPRAIIFSYLTCFGNSGPGQSTGVFVGPNFFAASGGTAPINIVSIATLFLKYNIFSGCAYGVEGVQNGYLIDEGDNSGALTAILNTYPTHGRSESYGGATPSLTNMLWRP